MIKGVNHQIIEITKPDHPYFERALLFVKSSYAEQAPDALRREGERFVKESDSFSALRSNRAMRWFRGTILLLIGGFVGMYVGILLQNV